MASVQMTHAERDGVEGTLVRVSVAAESEVFLPTRDPKELAQRRNQVLGELADHTMVVLNEVASKNSAQQRVMRTALHEQMKALEKRGVLGVPVLVLLGDTRDPEEQVLKSSLAMGQAIEKGEAKLEELDRTLAVDLQDRYLPVQEYLDAVMAEKQAEGESGDSSDGSEPPEPPLPTAWPAFGGREAEPPPPSAAVTAVPASSSSGGERERPQPPPPPPVPSAWPMAPGTSASTEGVTEEVYKELYATQPPGWHTREIVECYVLENTTQFMWQSRFHVKGSRRPTALSFAWPPELGTPPFIEAAMVPTYEAAVAAGDPGRLTRGGFLLFTQIHLAAKTEQENFWTKLTGMNMIWSKQGKFKANSLPDVIYWTHPRVYSPDGSADYVAIEGQYRVDNYRGVM
jgi:hypothetical protein